MDIKGIPDYLENYVLRISINNVSELQKNTVEAPHSVLHKNALYYASSAQMDIETAIYKFRKCIEILNRLDNY